MDGTSINYHPDHYKLSEYTETFDEYGSYPEILAYDVAEIDAEYKQAGYLGVNRKKVRCTYNSLRLFNCNYK